MLLRFFCIALALCVAAVPASAEQRYVVANSGGVLIVRQFDPAADLIGTQVRLQAGLDRQTPTQNGLAALVAESILKTPVAGGQSLQDAIAAQGGSIGYDIDPRAVRFYLEGIPEAYASMLALFRTALSHPDFSAPTLVRARTALDGRIAQTQQFALAVGLDMLNRTFYANSDAGMPPLGLPQTLAGFGPADAQSFFTAHYLQGGAIISSAGKLNAVNLDLEHALAGLAQGSSLPVKVSVRRLTSTSRQSIARRDIPVPWLIAQYTAPDLRSPDFGAMIILASLLQRTLGDVAGVPSLVTQSAAQRGVGAIYNFDTQPANIIVYVDGGGDPSRVFATALTIVNVLGHTKLQGDLSEMKTYAIGRFLNDATSLHDRAWLAGIFASQRLSPDFAARTVAAVNATTAKDLQRAAQRYLGEPNIALVLPRDTSQTSSP